MGQRFQSVFILPKIYMNEDNPNNRGKQVLVFHNQWLYGYTALRVNLDIIKRLKQVFRNRNKLHSELFKSKKDFINHFLEKYLLNAVEYSILKELDLRSKFNEPSGFKFKGFSDLGLKLSKEDNNNGFFICEITKDLKLKYTFLSGLEDDNTIKPKTAKQYLNLFYKDEVIKTEFDKKDKKLINDWLNGFNKIEMFLLYDIAKTTKQLNNNKPKWYKEYKKGLKNEK